MCYKKIRIDSILSNVMIMKQRIQELTEDMLADLGRLVRHDSRLAEPLPGKPFGEGPAAVLKEALEIASSMGFETKNLDNYCGYAQIGEGRELIGLVAHLDIVPPGEGWETDPFTLTRKGDTVYGRGVSDDKGAAVASLYTLKLLKESGIPLNKRIRLILGCNEETGSLCMKHYNEVEEPLTMGFTPDGEFPGIHGEKGMLKMTAYSKNTKILFMDGGFVSNAVCSRCETRVALSDVNRAKLQEALAKTNLESFTVEEENGVLVIRAEGIAAHASTPLLGVNAAGCIMKALAQAGMEDDFVEFYNSYIGTSCNGEGYGLKLKDAYGHLTLNNGIVRTDTEKGILSCTIDIRFPVTYSCAQIREKMAPYLEDEKGRTEINHMEEPLFYPPDSPLVQSLYQAYVDVTGDTRSKPMVIGGGTYAKYLPGIIAFGCAFLNTDNHIHDANERLSIEELKLQVEIYVEAVKRLLAG